MNPSERETDEVARMIWAFMLSRAVHVAAKLGVFDVLHGAPQDAAQVAAATGTHEPALSRLLRFLTSVGLLLEDENARFSVTPLGDPLRSDHPRSLRGLAIMYGQPSFTNAWGDLYETVRTGRTHFERHHGGTLFDYLASHADEAAVFNGGMTSLTKADVPVILGAYDFSRFKRIVDVAGGHGALLQAILERCPGARGVLYDVPAVIAGARHVASDRCELVEGDMFRSVPAGGDLYMMKKIIHDWDDDRCVQILEHCRHGLAPGGCVLVMDCVLESPNRPDLGKWLDLNMLALLPGHERTEQEFAELFARAGLRLTRVVPAGRMAIVEGVAAN
jgi:hypothetical protein